MAHIRNILFIVLYFAVTDMTSAAIPEYIKICKREQNTISDCVLNSIVDMMPYLENGIPEMNVPSTAPMSLDEVKLDLFHGYIKNVKLYGLNKLVFKKVHVDLDSKIIKATVAAPVVSFTGDCTIDAKILSIQIQGTGPISANITDCDLDAEIKYKLKTRDGKEYMTFTSCDVELRIGDYHVTLDALFNGNAAIGEAATAVMHQSKQDFLALVIPIVKETISKKVLEIGNKITATANYDEILPKP